MSPIESSKEGLCWCGFLLFELLRNFFFFLNLSGSSNSSSKFSQLEVLGAEVEERDRTGEIIEKSEFLSDFATVEGTGCGGLDAGISCGYTYMNPHGVARDGHLTAGGQSHLCGYGSRRVSSRRGRSYDPRGLHENRVPRSAEGL